MRQELRIRYILNHLVKIEICKFAASFIEDNDTIYFDCGTITYYLSGFLTKFRNLRIITNSLPVVSELLPYPNIICIC